jgi:hypothetical protein
MRPVLIKMMQQKGRSILKPIMPAPLNGFGFYLTGVKSGIFI